MESDIQRQQMNQPGSIILKRKISAVVWVPIVLISAFIMGYIVWEFSNSEGPHDNEIIPIRDF